MDDAETVTVFDGVDDGTDGISSFFFGVVLFVDNTVEEFAAGHVLENEIDVVVVLI
jgi:hypothetical protein